MSAKFNADEVFEMAIRIEENGAAFYRRAAELRARARKENVAQLLLLADMEDQHKATFAAMRNEFSDEQRAKTAFDPYLEATLYLNAIADAHPGEGAKSAADALTGKESMARVLRTAIVLEQNSIVFYLGIKDMVPHKMGKARIDKIISEEKNHVAILACELRKCAR